MLVKKLLLCETCNVYFVVSLNKKDTCKCPACKKKAKHLLIGDCRELGQKEAQLLINNKIYDIYYKHDKRQTWEINPCNRVRNNKKVKRNNQRIKDRKEYAC